MAVPDDHNIQAKAIGKLKKYTDLWIEVAKMWNIQVTIVPISIEAPNLTTDINKIGIKPSNPSTSEVYIAWLCKYSIKDAIFLRLHGEHATYLVEMMIIITRTTTTSTMASIIIIC